MSEVKLELQFLSPFIQTDPSWVMQRVTISNMTKNYRIIIERVIQTVGYSDVAIDDLSVQAGSCDALPTISPNQCAFTCPGSSTCVPRNKVCDFVADCPNGEEEAACGYNCNFENGTCRWVSNNGGAFQWTRFRGATPDSNTGPSRDHTTNSANGYYMYTDASNGTRNSQAYLTSPLLRSSSAACQLSFWYHMKGLAVGTLSVYKQEGYRKTFLWNTKRDHGDRWYQAIVPIGRMTAPFQMSITSVRSFSVLGDIAVDDIQFLHCAPPDPGTSCTPFSTFRYSAVHLLCFGNAKSSFRYSAVHLLCFGNAKSSFRYRAVHLLCFGNAKSFAIMKGKV